MEKARPLAHIDTESRHCTNYRLFSCQADVLLREGVSNFVFGHLNILYCICSHHYNTVNYVLGYRTNPFCIMFFNNCNSVEDQSCIIIITCRQHVLYIHKVIYDYVPAMA